MKRRISALLALLLVLAMLPTVAFAAGRDVSYEETLAADLKELGLFKGVSDTNFNLGRAPSRIEALVMLVRVLGKEQEALGGDWKHPFTDVPFWADKYVGYAYENGLTKGVSDTKFGEGNADARTYLTFVLRALGYSDAGGADFTWNSPYALASEVGILSDSVDLENFWRADVVLVSYAALPVSLKGGEETLAEKLISAGAFTKEAFDASFDPDFLKNAPKDQPASPEEEKPAAPTGKLSAQEISEKCAGAVFSVTGYAFNGEVLCTGSGFFISSDGLAVTNYHVILNCYTVSITLSDGTVYDNVAVTDNDRDTDLAFLRVKGSGFPCLEMGDSSQLKQGQRVYAIGSPLGLSNTMSEGIISNPKRTIDGTDYVQISVPINSGSSGGALLDEYGKVVGVTTAGYINTTGDLNLAVGINSVSVLDRNDMDDYVTWSDTYYPSFSLVLDFGKFSGVDLVEAKTIPKGIVCAYDADDFHASPYGSATDNYFNTVYYYHSALLLNGFAHEGDGETYGGLYATDTETIYIAVDSENGLIYVVVQRVTQYCEACPGVPDAGWYLGLEPYSEGEIESAYGYLYFWDDHYSAAEFAQRMALYLELLEEEGFAFVQETDNGWIHQGNGWILIVDVDYESVVLVAERMR